MLHCRSPPKKNVFVIYFFLDRNALHFFYLTLTTDALTVTTSVFMLGATLVRLPQEMFVFITINILYQIVSQNYFIWIRK